MSAKRGRLLEESGRNPQPKGLELVDVTKRLGDVDVVRNLDLEVHEGEFLTLLGPSGSGKSTTLNLIAGFLRPDVGDIRIGGTGIVAIPPEKRNIGIVFQSYALFPHLTIAENVAFPLRRRGVRGMELKERVIEALRLVALEDRLTAQPSELSGGQQQRVALARALVFEPRLVLLDEPLGALDRRLRQNLQEHLRELHHRLGFTAVYVTHDQEEALFLSDRIAIMTNGTLAQLGTGKALYQRPVSVFVARFLGDANIFDGEVLDLSDEGCVVRLSNGTQVSATLSQGNSIRRGGPAVIVARPEALTVRASGHPTSEMTCDYLCTGTMTEQVFLGSDLQSVVRTADDQLITIRERDKVFSGHECRPGEEVEVIWRDRAAAVAVEGPSVPPTT